MNRTSGKRLRLFAIKASIFLLVLLFAIPVIAQRPAGPPGTPANDPVDPINQDKTNKADMRNREFMMGNTRKPIRRAVWGPAAAALPQIKDDFEQIQIVNKELMTEVFANNVLNPKRIVKATSDIEKRASRLINNLAYPQPLDSDKILDSIHERDDIRQTLSKLDSTIMVFVSNPIFQTNRQVVNTELAKKVNGELEAIVKLSESIRRQAEAMTKAKKGP
jgi:hypothetical protein